MTSKKHIEIHVNGYVCKIVCGGIPVPAREAIAQHLITNRDESQIPEWMRKRYPSYVNPDAVKDLWYGQNDVISGIMTSCGAPWTGYRDINGFCLLRGFGTGKGDIGLFDIEVFEEGDKAAGFLPFEPTVDMGVTYGPIDRIEQVRALPPEVPRAAEGYVAVSGGSWAKGTMVFSASSEEAFYEDGLQIVLCDLTDICVGEDHFVSGFRYRGVDLPGKITRETEKEMYPVSWYSMKKGRWLSLNEPE